MPPEKNIELIKEVQNANKELAKSVKDSKKEISSNKSTEEINDSVADLVGDVKEVLNDVSKTSKSADKALDSVIDACEKCEKQFENAESVSDAQIKNLEKVCNELDKVDIDVGDGKKAEDLEDECIENINKLSGALKKAQKLLKKRLKKQKQKSNAISDMNEDLSEAIEDAKELISGNGSTTEISNDLSDLLSDLEQDLNDASKCDRDIDKELDDLVEQCHTGATLFKNSSEVTDEQLTILNNISTICSKVDVDVEGDDSLEKASDKSFISLSKVSQKIGKVLSNRKKSYAPVLENLEIISKSISVGIESFEKNYGTVFGIMENSCELIKKTGQGFDALNSLNNCIKICKNAYDNWGKSDINTKSSLLVEVCSSIQLVYNCISHPQFKKIIKEICDKLTTISKHLHK